ncbi:MAG TPA: TlpA disulfide reductase family protein [Deltaproteobacteria bacterium]|nr:TlpA disulfide reductase family protein [Deltaproteobacteria bacterium]
MAAMNRVFLRLTSASVFILAGVLFWHEYSGDQKNGEVKENILAAPHLGPLRAITPPQVLPKFRFVDRAGEEHTLADFRGKMLLVNIWATWCPPCREEMPSLDRLQSQIGSDDFYVLTISTDLNGISTVQDFFWLNGITSLEAYADFNGETENALKVPGLPTTLLIDKKGDAIGVMVGPTEWDSEEIIAVISAQLSPEVKLENR